MPLCVYLCYAPGCQTKLERWMPTAEEGQGREFRVPALRGDHAVRVDRLSDQDAESQGFGLRHFPAEAVGPEATSFSVASTPIRASALLRVHRPFASRARTCCEGVGLGVMAD